MNQQMSLEDYKKEIVNYLINHKVKPDLIKSWMKVYDKDIEEAYNKHWKVKEIAVPMILGH